MNKVVVIGAVLIIAVVAIYFYVMNRSGSSYQVPTPTPTVSSKTPTPVPVPVTHAVTIQNFSFNSSSIIVKKGDTVVWTNNDAVGHTVTGDNGGPASSTISPGGTYSFKFNTAGTFGYHCSIHPSMTGTIIVQ